MLKNYEHKRARPRPASEIQLRRKEDQLQDQVKGASYRRRATRQRFLSRMHRDGLKGGPVLLCNSQAAVSRNLGPSF